MNKSFAAAALGVAKFIANTVFEFGHTVALLTSDSDVHKTAISGRFKTSKSDLRSTKRNVTSGYQCLLLICSHLKLQLSQNFCSTNRPLSSYLRHLILFIT